MNTLKGSFVSFFLSIMKVFIIYGHRFLVHTRNIFSHMNASCKCLIGLSVSTTDDRANKQFLRSVWGQSELLFHFWIINLKKLSRKYMINSISVRKIYKGSTNDSIQTGFVLYSESLNHLVLQSGWCSWQTISDLVGKVDGLIAGLMFK